MKMFVGLLCAFLVMLLSTAVDTQAQSFMICNHSTIAVPSATIQFSACASPATVSLAPGACFSFPVPAGCTVTGVVVNGNFYPLNFMGVIVPATQKITVGYVRASILNN